MISMRPKSFILSVFFFCIFYINDSLSSEASDFVGISNGRRANSTDLRFQVALKFKNSFYCSGIIISDRYILTAAYCIPENRMYHPDVTALAGTQDLDRGGATYRVARGIRHHRYNFLDMDYDIGLFKLRTPVTYSHVLEVAPLAYRGPLFRKGMKFKISGWGWPSFATQTISRYLLQSEVLWMDQDTCREKRQNFSAPQSYRQFCSTIDNGPCMFDFGGPVIYNGTVIGIISGASWPCGTYPPIYTKVSAYDEWIVENMEELDRTV